MSDLIHVLVGFISSVISSIERRYNLSSTQAGIMVITYDITVTISVIFVSYFGAKSHQPRLLGLATLLLAFGSFLFSLPHFILQVDEYSSDNDGALHQYCSNNANSSSTEDCSNVNAIAYTIFIISNIILGIASSPIYTIGISYLDEIAFPRYVSLHIGMVSTTLIVGPVVAFGLGSIFLSIYVNPLTDTSLTTSDPAWVGAWWMPFLLTSFCLFILAVPFLMFPRYLPDSPQVWKERAKEMAKIYSEKYANENSTSIVFKMFPIHIKRLIRNPSFMFAVFGLCSLYIFLQGVISFGPKYYEVQFRSTASTSTLLVGGTTIPGASQFTYYHIICIRHYFIISFWDSCWCFCGFWLQDDRKKQCIINNCINRYCVFIFFFHAAPLPQYTYCRINRIWVSGIKSN